MSRQLEQPVSLPVLDKPRPRSRVQKWRVASLIALHVLILIHVFHWIITGQSLAPVVLSNAMYTLELGQINPAFVLFAVLILLTLLFGRFFCGWACHMGALQDLAYWLLRKTNVRPVLFRTRFLVYLPAGIALYMFIWPTFKRELLAPAFATWWPGGMKYLGHVQPFPGWSTQWTTTQLWDGLPGLWVAIFFLFTCGVASVYFLGPRGFCQYGCPYGGILKPVERLAPGRIVVDSSRCDQCGQCTAACTSNVDVLRELRKHGGVVSSHCTKNLDCISVCPHNALAFRAARPPAASGIGLAMTQRKMDATLAEEIGLLAVFTAVFLITRGLYNTVPMLFAVGIGVCAMVVAWKASRLIRDRDVVLNRIQLKRAGSIRMAGAVFVVAATAAALLVVQGGLVKYHSWRGGVIDGQVTVSRQMAFNDPSAIAPDAVELAAKALEHYRRASSWRSGGVGLANTPNNDLRSAWLLTVVGSYDEAQRMIDRVLERNTRNIARGILFTERARLMLIAGHSDDAISYLETAVQEHGPMTEVAHMLASLHMQAGRADRAIAELHRHLARLPDDGLTRASLGRMYFSLGDVEAASTEFDHAVRLVPNNAEVLQGAARTALARGDRAKALQLLNQAAQAPPARPAGRHSAAANVRRY